MSTDVDIHSFSSLPWYGLWDWAPVIMDKVGHTTNHFLEVLQYLTADSLARYLTLMGMANWMVLNRQSVLRHS